MALAGHRRLGGLAGGRPGGALSAQLHPAPGGVPDRPRRRADTPVDHRAALLTFTGVVFSITLVALQMASTQYSPRVLRTFVRKPVTKLALSIFIATFVYSLALLARVGSTTGLHGPAGRGRRGLSARDGVGARVRLLRPLHGAVHACDLRD